MEEFEALRRKVVSKGYGAAMPYEGVDLDVWLNETLEELDKATSKTAGVYNRRCGRQLMRG